jgi:hypothetical protein
MSVPRSRFTSGQQPEAPNITATNFPARDRTQLLVSRCPTTRWQIIQFAADPNMLRKQTHFNSLICRHKPQELHG